MDDAELADRLAIHRLSDAYADAADRRDAVAFSGLFLPDATLQVIRDGAEPSTFVGHDRLAEIPAMLARYRTTLHVVTNHHCTLDRDLAHGGAICQAHHLIDDATGADPTTSDLVLNIRYRDSYARTGAGWRFATREVHILWTSTGPVTSASPL
jgi:hypothetical protein